jgi:2-(1,2-epoxy-1,2-dihydrophenyl)acetyl-CoA isomerase
VAARGSRSPPISSSPRNSLNPPWPSRSSSAWCRTWARAGSSRAIGLALLGDRLAAATAAEWGLIWRCVPDDALHAEASALAGCIAAAARNDFSVQLDIERDLQSALVRSDDFVEAVTAFREKRAPVFGAGEAS